MMIFTNRNSGSSKSVLIVALPDSLRDSLTALLIAVPGLQVINQVNSGASACRLIMQHRPELVVLNANLPDNQSWVLVKLIKMGRLPQSRCLVLVDTIEQQQRAIDVGADVALLKGFAVTELFTAVEKLLFSQVINNGAG